MLNKNKHSLKSVIRKIFAAFLLVSIAITLALLITRFSFREMMGTVEELSEPNEKLTILNSLFEEITTLDQLQRAEAIQNPHKPYNTFLDQSASLNHMIDSLKTLPWDTSQLNKLDEMKTVLSERNKLFFSYLKVKAKILDNREFAVQLDTLAAILQSDKLTIDSTITTQKRTTTTFLPDTTPLKKSEKRSLLKNLFNKKKKTTPVDTPMIRVREELSFLVDTTAITKQNEALAEIEKIMREMETDQRSQRRRLQQQELELIHANSLFINKLLSILHIVEKEELQQIREKNAHAVTVMNQSMSRITMLMLGFFVAAALLVYLIWLDVTKSNYYKEALEKARDEAEQLSQIKQRFLANMSHEIRTPLQSIIGFAEQLKQKNGNKQEEVEAIYSSSEHLLHIVNEVLDYSRISSGNFTLAKEKFRLNTLIREVESAMRVQAERKNLAFVLDLEKASEYTLTGDPFRLRQILYNLLGNAIKFTHRGFIKLSVRTIEEDEYVRCVFEVIDTGIGINKDDLDNIFNHFEQADTSISQQYGGTGLGLTIVKSLVDAQEGMLEVSSEPGVGSCFHVELKYEKAAAAYVNKIQYGKSIQIASSFKGKVLLVDDDPLILRLCSLILHKNKISHHVFSSATEALQHEPDPEVSHIFLDIRMPDINGVDLCKALRKKYHSSTRFIALTAHVLPEEKNSIIKQGFDTILQKPFHEGELLNLFGVNVSAPFNEPEEQPNLSMLRKMTMGDEALFQSIISQFIDETIDDLQKLKENIRQQNSKALREIVHKMAGRFAQLGMTSFAARLQTLEKQLVAGQKLEGLSNDFLHVMRKTNEIVTQIRLTNIEQLN